MKRILALSFVVCSLSHAAIIDAYTPFSEKGSSLKELAVWEFTPTDMRPKAVQTQDGHNYTLRGFDITRTTRLVDGQSEIVLTARAIIFDEDKAEQDYQRRRRTAPKGRFVPKIRTQIYASLEQPKTGTVQSHPLELSTVSDRASIPAGFDSRTVSNELRIKSVDYDETTGEWSNVKIAETLYTQYHTAPKAVLPPRPGLVPGEFKEIP